MPLLGTRGGAAARGFGFSGGSETFMEATGGSIATSGDFKIHTFTSSGTFEVTTEYSDPSAYPVEVLVVAGGGGGGDGTGNGGAGGAGGYLEGTFTNLTEGSSLGDAGGGDGGGGGS